MILKTINKIIALTIIFALVIEQSGFAQVVGPMAVPAYINGYVAADRFRPLQLRSITFDQINNDFNLFLDKGDLQDLRPKEIKENAAKLSEYFQIGLRLPNSIFWVNLRPDSQDQIIDPWLEKTDLGKVMLEADLQLKKDMANFTSPKTDEGKKYWDDLYKKAEELFGQSEITIPTLTRPWIVPGEILIRQTKDNAYIYKANLNVMLEQDYLKDAPGYKFDDPRLKTLNEYSSELIRREILPKLIREVNSSKKYAGLRQVYYSLVLAQWFKQSHNVTKSQVTSKIDSYDLSGLTSKNKWSKETYFKAYKKSFAKGEYKLQETKSRLSGTSIRQYFSGGEKLVIPLLGSSNFVNPAVAGDIASQNFLPDYLRDPLIEVTAGKVQETGVQQLEKNEGAQSAKKDGGRSASLIDEQKLENMFKALTVSLRNVEYYRGGSVADEGYGGGDLNMGSLERSVKKVVESREEFERLMEYVDTQMTVFYNKWYSFIPTPRIRALVEAYNMLGILGSGNTLKFDKDAAGPVKEGYVRLNNGFTAPDDLVDKVQSSLMKLDLFHARDLAMAARFPGVFFVSKKTIEVALAAGLVREDRSFDKEVRNIIISSCKGTSVFGFDISNPRLLPVVSPGPQFYTDFMRKHGFNRDGGDAQPNESGLISRVKRYFYDWRFNRLLSQLVSENEGIRFSSVQALGELKDPRAVEPLIPLLKDKDMVVLVSAIEALGEIGDTRAQPAIEDVLKSAEAKKYRSIRRYVARALANFKNDRSAVVLAQLREDVENFRDGGEVSPASAELNFEQRKVLSDFLDKSLSRLYSRGPMPVLFTVNDPIACIEALPITNLYFMLNTLDLEAARQVVSLLPEGIRKNLSEEARKVQGEVMVNPVAQSARALSVSGAAHPEEASVTMAAASIVSIAGLLTYILGHGVIAKLSDYSHLEAAAVINPAVHHMLGNSVVVLTSGMDRTPEENKIGLNTVVDGFYGFIDSILDPATTVKVADSNGQGLPFEARMNRTTISVGDISKIYLDRETGNIAYEVYWTNELRQLKPGTREYDLYYNEMVGKVVFLQAANLHDKLLTVDQEKDLASILQEIRNYKPDDIVRQVWTDSDFNRYIRDPNVLQVESMVLDRQTGAIVKKNSFGMELDKALPGDKNYATTLQDMRKRLKNAREWAPPAGKYFFDTIDSELKHYQALGSVTITPENQVPITVSMNVSTITAGGVSMITLDRKTGELHYGVYWTGENRLVKPTDPDYQTWIKQMLGSVHNALQANLQTQTLSPDEIYFLANVEHELRNRGNVPYEIVNPTAGMPIIAEPIQANVAVANSLQEDKGIPVIGDIVSFMYDILGGPVNVRVIGADGRPFLIAMDFKTISIDNISLNMTTGDISESGMNGSRRISPAAPEYKDLLGRMHGLVAEAESAGNEKQQKSLAFVESKLKGYDSGFAYVVVRIGPGLQQPYGITMDSGRIIAAQREFERSTGAITWLKPMVFPLPSHYETVYPGQYMYPRELGNMLDYIAKARNVSTVTVEQQALLTLVETELRKYENQSAFQKDGGSAQKITGGFDKAQFYRYGLASAGIVMFVAVTSGFMWGGLALAGFMSAGSVIAGIFGGIIGGLIGSAVAYHATTKTVDALHKRILPEEWEYLQTHKISNSEKDGGDFRPMTKGQIVFILDRLKRDSKFAAEFYRSTGSGLAMSADLNIWIDQGLERLNAIARGGKGRVVGIRDLESLPAGPIRNLMESSMKFYSGLSARKGRQIFGKEGYSELMNSRSSRDGGSVRSLDRLRMELMTNDVHPEIVALQGLRDDYLDLSGLFNSPEEKSKFEKTAHDLNRVVGILERDQWPQSLQAGELNSLQNGDILILDPGTFAIYHSHAYLPVDNKYNFLITKVDRKDPAKTPLKAKEEQLDIAGIRVLPVAPKDSEAYLNFIRSYYNDREQQAKDGGSQTPTLDELKGTDHSLRTKREADSLYSGRAAESSSRSSGSVNTDFDEFDGGTVRNNGRQQEGIDIMWGGGIIQLPQEVIEDLGKAWNEVLASDARKDIEIVQSKLEQSRQQIKDLEMVGPGFQTALKEAKLAHAFLRQLAVYEIFSLKEKHGAATVKAELEKIIAQPFLDPEIKKIGEKAREELISLDPTEAYLRKARISADYVRMIYDTLEMLSRTEPKALYDLYLLAQDPAYVLKPESLRTLVIYILVETDGHIVSPQIKDIVRAAVKEIKNNQVVLVESAGALHFNNLKDGGTPMEQLVAEIESAARNKDITALVRLRWELIDLQQKGVLDEIALARDSISYNNEQLLKDGLKRAKEEGVTSVFSGFKEWIEIDKAIQLAESGHYVGFPYRLGRDKAVMIVLYPTEKELVARYGANANRQDGGEISQRKLLTKIRFAVRKNDTAALKRLHGQLIQFQQDQIMFAVTMAGSSILFNGEAVSVDAMKRFKAAGVTWIFNGFEKKVGIDKAIQDVGSGEYTAYLYRVGIENDPLIILHPTEQGLISRYQKAVSQQDGGSAQKKSGHWKKWGNFAVPVLELFGEYSPAVPIRFGRYDLGQGDKEGIKTTYKKAWDNAVNEKFIFFFGSNILNAEEYHNTADYEVRGNLIVSGIEVYDKISGQRAGVFDLPKPLNVYNGKVTIENDMLTVTGEYEALFYDGQDIYDLNTEYKYVFRIQENGKLVFLEELSSDYDKKTDGGYTEHPVNTGGVDFRALPAQVTPMVNSPAGAGLSSLKDLDNQWSQIQSKIYQGEMPYQEIKLYVSSCCGNKAACKQLETVSEGITNILKMEEERALPTTPELKEILSCLG